MPNAADGTRDIATVRENSNKPKACTCKVPARPKSADYECDEEVTVHIMKNKSLYIRSDHLPWLLAYSQDELHFAGIELKPEGVGQKEANCKEPGVNIEYDFQRKGFVGVFLDGPMKDCNVFVNPTGPVIEHNWELLQADGFAP